MTTDPIRAQVVEAMAQAIHNTDDLANASMNQRRIEAEAALDALLDVLEAIGEIPQQAQAAPALPVFSAGLLAVLRAGKGSDE